MERDERGGRGGGRPAWLPGSGPAPPGVGAPNRRDGRGMARHRWTGGWVLWRAGLGLVLGLGLGAGLAALAQAAAFGPRLAVALAAGLLLGVLAVAWPGACRTLALALLLPLLGLARRLLDAAGAPAAYDPLLLVAPLLGAWLAARLAATARPALQQALSRSVPAQLVLLLVAYLALEAANPVQGSLLAGLGGALVFLGPVPWFLLGLAGIDRAALERLLRLVALGAAASALSGLGQLVFGFLPVETAWISQRGYPSLGVGGFVRPFGTFTSAEEWSRFLELGAVLAVAGALAPRPARQQPAWCLPWAWLGRSGWLGCAALCLAGLVASGVRSSLFGALMGLLVALVLGVRSTAGRGAVLLGAAALGLGLVVAGELTATAGQGTSAPAATAAEALVSQTWRGLVAPLGESTLWLRLASWQEIVTHDLVERPLGAGLGAASLAMQKFGGPPGVGAESSLFSLLVAGGLPAGVLFLAVAAAALGRSLRQAAEEARAGRRAPSDGTALAVAAGLAALFVNSVVGSSLVLPSVAPLGWLLLGWALRPAENAVHEESQERISLFSPPCARDQPVSSLFGT